MRAQISDRTVSSNRIVACCLAIVSLATAVIHFAVAGSHFQEYWLFGVFMLAAAWLQLAWAILTTLRPSRLLLWAGILLNAGIVAVYVLTRTTGTLIGPTPHETESVGFADAFCTTAEVAVLIGCAWLLAARTDRRVPQRRLAGAVAAVGSVMAVVLSVALVDGGPDMVMAASTGHATRSSGSHMRMAATHAAPVRLATNSPAGFITLPDPNMQMEPGMRMSSASMCAARPTPRQQHAAVRLVDASWKGAARFRHLAAAEAAGYRAITPPGLAVVHYLNVSYYLHAFSTGRVLNTAEPQSLVYANTPKGAVLVAAMYITTPGGATPQPGGCLTQWHVHTNLCLTRGGSVVGFAIGGSRSCPPGSRNRITPPMMHVWFVPVPGGPTAIDASNVDIVHAAEQVRSPRNGPT